MADAPQKARTVHLSAAAKEAARKAKVAILKFKSTFNNNKFKCKMKKMAVIAKKVPAIAQDFLYHQPQELNNIDPVS